MKRFRVTALCFLLISFVLLVSCGSAKTDLPDGDCVRVTVRYLETADADGVEVVMEDEQEIDKLLRFSDDFLQDKEAVSSSKPMDFPRYELRFETESGEAYDLYIDTECVFSGTLTGELGNHWFPEGSDVSYYEDIDAIFQEARSE